MLSSLTVLYQTLLIALCCFHEADAAVAVSCIFGAARLTDGLLKRAPQWVCACVVLCARTDKLRDCRRRFREGPQRLSSVSLFVCVTDSRRKADSRFAKLSDSGHGHESAKEPVCGL